MKKIAYFLFAVVLVAGIATLLLKTIKLPEEGSFFEIARAITLTVIMTVIAVWTIHRISHELLQMDIDSRTSREEFEQEFSLIKVTCDELCHYGRFWGDLGALRLIRRGIQVLRLLKRKSEALSVEASTFYNAGSNASAHFQLSATNGLRKVLATPWFLRAVWYFGRAFYDSNRLVRLASGVEKMTPPDLEVRAAIVLRAGLRNDAIRCIENAISNTEVTLSQEALLRARKGQVLDAMGQFDAGGNEFDASVEFIKHLPNILQARLWRMYGGHRIRTGDIIRARTILEAAREMANKKQWGDEKIKIDVLLKQIEPVGK